MSDVGANIAAGTSAASATFAWIAQANQIASLLASVVAIVAGLCAIVHYTRYYRKP
jgi:hypothetical protein